MMCSLVTGVQTCALPIAALIAGIEAAGLTPFQFQQWEGKRLTRSFGWTYDFQTGRFAPGEPIPFWLDAIRSRAARFAGIDPDKIGRAHVRTPVTNAHLVCRLLLEKTKRHTP